LLTRFPTAPTSSSQLRFKVGLRPCGVTAPYTMWLD
jgi:hypothetical protein